MKRLWSYQALYFLMLEFINIIDKEQNKICLNLRKMLSDYWFQSRVSRNRTTYKQSLSLDSNNLNDSLDSPLCKEISHNSVVCWRFYNLQLCIFYIWRLKVTHLNSLKREIQGDLEAWSQAYSSWVAELFFSSVRFGWFKRQEVYSIHITNRQNLIRLVGIYKYFIIQLVSD